MKLARITHALLPVLVLLGTSVATVSAQKADPERAASVLQKARALEQQIVEHGATRASRLEAARLHIESARARPQSDPAAVGSLIAAAGHVGELDPAWSARLYNSAAETALALGDIETAAHAYLDAASVLGNSKASFTEVEGSKLSGWFHKARLLSNSPLLAADQRQRLMDRLYPAVAF